ncbi:XRE family transcriptional regulator [Eleftheria terrae]|uniref:XRE family transcriptional regulator n=1 Tax=Eleftheria terrae TaxID=1597781 RepID=UPI00263BC034|nr:XRE family transcriptional regulator [Eleftheria terrae]WKB54556.1 XRE family transcriptional regulator [Eleftheria terrae]
MKSKPTLVLQHVATNLRAARLARGLSQEALATASDVSRRMLVSLENGDTNVSLVTLDRIATALGLAFAELLRPPGNSAVRGEPVLAWRGRQAGSHALLLESLRQPLGIVELWEFRLAAGDRYDAQPDSPGFHEMLYVVDGSVCVLTSSGSRALGAGQSWLFASDQAYVYENSSDAPTTFVRNVIAPRG